MEWVRTSRDCPLFLRHTSTWKLFYITDLSLSWKTCNGKALCCRHTATNNLFFGVFSSQHATESVALVHETEPIKINRRISKHKIRTPMYCSFFFSNKFNNKRFRNIEQLETCQHNHNIFYLLKRVLKKKCIIAPASASPRHKIVFICVKMTQKHAFTKYFYIFISY